jgi:hypothetical protein
MSKDKQKGTKSEFLKMVKELGLTPTEVKEMLGAPTRKADGTVRHAKGGMVKKKMMRGGMAAKTTPKRMRGGGMAKMASKKMMRGGAVKKK